MKKWLMTAALLFGSMVSVFAFANGRHVHGEAEMDVVLDGNELAIGISGPLPNFLGFEHAPKDERQKKALVDMTGDLHEGDRLFGMNPESGCSFVSSLVSVRKGEQVAHPDMLQSLASSKQDGHVDLNATYAFACKNPDALRSVKVQLFSRFPGLTQIDVRMVLPKRQAASRLTAQNPILSW